jgi:hypothetical protein
MKSEEEILYEICINNVYMLLTGKQTFGDIMDYGNAWFIFNSLDDLEINRNKYIDEAIQYYEEIEEYEKCNELLKIKDEELVE